MPTKLPFSTYLKVTMAGALLFGALFASLVVLGLLASVRVPGWSLLATWAIAMSFVVAFAARYVEMRRR